MSNATRKNERQKRIARPQDTMLADFLRATTPQAKRRVIEQFNALYFLLATPQPTKENLNEQMEV